jgi:hypothetical protein
MTRVIHCLTSKYKALISNSSTPIKRANAGEDVKEWEFSYTLGGNINYYNSYVSIYPISFHIISSSSIHFATNDIISFLIMAE